MNYPQCRSRSAFTETSMTHSVAWSRLPQYREAERKKKDTVYKRDVLVYIEKEIEGNQLCANGASGWIRQILK